MFVGGRNRFDTLVKDIQCTFSTKWLVCAYHAVVFKTKILQFKNENAPTKTQMERNLTLFSSWQSTWLVLDHPRHPCFLYSKVKESKFLKEKFLNL